MQGTAFGNAFNEGLANMTVDIGANLGERIGQSIAGSEDAWKGFGNDILKMIGTFLIQLGTALITYGVLMEAFKNSPPLVKIAVGAAAIIAGGILLGIAAGGSNIGSSGSTSSSSGGGSYSSPNTQAQDNKVVFEIQGSKLVGVLNNVDKRNNNFK